MRWRRQARGTAEMVIWQIVLGFFVSTVIAAVVLYVLIDKLAWPYLARKQKIPAKPSGLLTLPLGMAGRVLYTTAILAGTPQWIAVWLAFKVAVIWNRWQGPGRASYNVVLLGNALSMIFAIIGASIALGRPPCQP